jgi:hypothetical protein
MYSIRKSRLDHSAPHFCFHQLCRLLTPWEGNPAFLGAYRYLFSSNCVSQPPWLGQGTFKSLRECFWHLNKAFHKERGRFSGFPIQINCVWATAMVLFASLTKDGGIGYFKEQQNIKPILKCSFQVIAIWYL